MLKRYNLFLSVICGICFILIIVFYCSPKKDILYSTDLSIDGDFDDYFDLVAMQTLKGDSLYTIIDGNNMQSKKSGLSAIKDLSYIGGVLFCHSWTR